MDRDQNERLIEGVTNQNKELVKDALENGADINNRVNDLTPLQLAIRKDYYSIVQVIVDALEAGGDSVVSLETVNGYGALLECVKTNRVKCLEILLSNKGALKLDLEKRIWSQGAEDFTLLHLAVLNNKTKITVVEKLLKNGANIKAVTSNGRNVLMIAAKTIGDKFKLLIEHPNVDMDLLNQTNTQGETALQIAITSKNVYAVRKLLVKKDALSTGRGRGVWCRSPPIAMIPSCST